MGAVSVVVCLYPCAAVCSSRCRSVHSPVHPSIRASTRSSARRYYDAAFKDNTSRNLRLMAACLGEEFTAARNKKEMLLAHDVDVLVRRLHGGKHWGDEISVRQLARRGGVVRRRSVDYDEDAWCSAKVSGRSE